MPLPLGHGGEASPAAGIAPAGGVTRVLVSLCPARDPALGKPNSSGVHACVTGRQGSSGRQLCRSGPEFPRLVRSQEAGPAAGRWALARGPPLRKAPGNAPCLHLLKGELPPRAERARDAGIAPRGAPVLPRHLFTAVLLFLQLADENRSVPRPRPCLEAAPAGPSSGRSHPDCSHLQC